MSGTMKKTTMLISLIIIYLFARVNSSEETTKLNEPCDGIPKAKTTIPKKQTWLEEHNGDHYIKTCEKFLENTTFDPFKVLDVEWKVWYFWSLLFEESFTVKFSIPTKDVIDHYEKELNDEVKPQVNWDDAILFIDTISTSTLSLSGLLIKTEVDGQFRLIPSQALEYVGISDVIVAMKVVKAGYLAIFNCMQGRCYALAPIDKMPYYETYDGEAKKVGCYGDHPRSHISFSPPPKSHLHTEAFHDMHNDDFENSFVQDDFTHI